MTKLPKKSKAPTCAYEMPNPEKIGYGKRLRHAREIAGMTATDAAHRMGYAQPVQLSNMENGKRLPPLRVLYLCAVMYGTTMDYLCGLSEDSDRDPASAALRHITSRVSADVQRLVNSMATASVDVVRELMPSGAQGQRVSALAIEANMALARFAQKNPTFEDMRGGAEVLRKVQAAAEAGVQYVAQVERSKRILRAHATQAMTTAAESAAADGPQQLSFMPVLDLTEIERETVRA